MFECNNKAKLKLQNARVPVCQKDLNTGKCSGVPPEGFSVCICTCSTDLCNLLAVEPNPALEPNPVVITTPSIPIPIPTNFLEVNVIPIPIPKKIGIITPLVQTLVSH